MQLSSKTAVFYDVMSCPLRGIDVSMDLQSQAVRRLFFYRLTPEMVTIDPFETSVTLRQSAKYSIPGDFSLQQIHWSNFRFCMNKTLNWKRGMIMFRPIRQVYEVLILDPLISVCSENFLYCLWYFLVNGRIISPCRVLVVIIITFHRTCKSTVTLSSYKL